MCRTVERVNQCLDLFFSSGIEHNNDIYSCAQLEANNNNTITTTNNQKPIECVVDSDPICVPDVKHEPSVVLETVVQIVPSKCLPREHNTPKEPIATNNTREPQCIKSPVAPAVVVATHSSHHQPPAKSTATFVKEHRPRSVTASVFAPVTNADHNNNNTPKLVAIQLHQSHQRTAGVQFKPSLTPSLALSNASAVGTLPTLTCRPKIQSAAMNKGFMMFLDEGNDSKYMLSV